MAEGRVQLGAAVLHRAAVATEHDDVATAIDEVLGRRGEGVDGGEQPAEHPFAHGLWADVRVAVSQRVPLGFMPLNVGRHGPEEHGGIVVRESGISRLKGLHTHLPLRRGMGNSIGARIVTPSCARGKSVHGSRGRYTSTACCWLAIR